MAKSLGIENRGYAAPYCAECVWKCLAVSGSASIAEEEREEDVD